MFLLRLNKVYVYVLYDAMCYRDDTTIAFFFAANKIKDIAKVALVSSSS